MRKLTDRFGRVHDYLRVSFTDKCNLRCHYCMPENAVFRPHSALLSKEEILHITRTMVNEFGVKKVRITGGEPLVRKDAGEIIEELSRLPVELAITTNGVLLRNYFTQFERIGLRAVNISLDSLNRNRNERITNRPFFKTVRENITLAMGYGLKVRVNMVVIRGVNDDELINFVEWTKDTPVHIRFIEFMPFDGNQWNWEKVVPYKEMLESVKRVYPVSRLHDKPGSTAKSYSVPGYAGTFAVISSITSPFCGDCNRIRLTADGKLKNCLFAMNEADVITPLRQGRDITQVIIDCMEAKHAERGGLTGFDNADAQQAYEGGRCMSAIGG